MTLLIAVIVGLLMGIVFGFALEKSRVFEPGMIVGQMQLRNFIMLKVFMTAVATGAVVLAVLNGFDIVKLAPKGAFYVADVVGGLILGIGITLAGACPGTALAQIGAGYRDALFILAGGLAGTVAFSYAQPTLSGTVLAEDGGKILLSDLIGIPYWPAALGLAVVFGVFLIMLERRRAWSSEMGSNVDGDFGELPPSASATTIDRVPAQ
jgi:hypothetical protein